MRVRIASVVAALAAATMPAPAVAAGDPVMPLAEVRAGMDCRALSVVRGTAPAEFRVAVIDVVRGDSPALGARILFRASGPAVDATGIGQGFSGSPIYCPDGRGGEAVIGAISEGIGEWGNHVALATPIEQILGVRPAAPPRARRADLLLRSARPLAAPLTIAGLSAPVRSAALAGARAAGFPLLAAPAGPATPYAPYDPLPGTSIAVAYSTGDLTLAAVGTVSYRDGDSLWAFGHELEAGGRRSLPLLDAYVYTVVANPLGSEDLTTYKLASAGRTVGTLSRDGLAAVAGRVGPVPATIPLRARARDTTNGRTHTIRSRVADERAVGLGSQLGMVASFAAADVAASAMGANPPSPTTRMCVRVAVAKRPQPLRFCQRYFDSFGPFEDLSSALGMVTGYKFGPLGIRSVDVGLQVRPRVREAFVVGVRAPDRVRPGERIRVALTLRMSRAGLKRISFPMRVPRAARPGRRVLTVRGRNPGGGGLAEFFSVLLGGGGGKGGGGPARSVPELAARFAAFGEPDGVSATFAPKGRGPVVYRGGELLIRGRSETAVVVERRD